MKDRGSKLVSAFSRGGITLSVSISVKELQSENAPKEGNNFSCHEREQRHGSANVPTELDGTVVEKDFAIGIQCKEVR